LKRLILLLAFCIVGFNASAQFWRLWRKPLPAVAEVQMQQPVIAIAKPTIPLNAIINMELDASDYVKGIEEAAMIKVAKHNMRYREYVSASYNFSDLADLYIRQNRFSEAKWFLLQSNAIARNTDNNRHLISNLMILADIKAVIGETALAIVDLQEALKIAKSNDVKVDIAAIDRKIKNFQTNKSPITKAELRYANAVEIANSAKAAPVN
jgi:predicted transcriptional regulator